MLHPAGAVATIVILLKKTALYIISAVMAPALWSAVDGVCAALRSDATFCADIHDTKADTSMVSAQAVSLTPVSVLRPPHKTGYCCLTVRPNYMLHPWLIVQYAHLMPIRRL